VLCFGGKEERPVADERETLVLKIADLKADLKALTELVGFMDEDGEAVDDENTDKLRSLKKEIADHEAKLQELDDDSSRP
jgi:hypothetical protein